jgi:sigma-B regulation protein RsbU (phosphoserine phosphatase)
MKTQETELQKEALRCTKLFANASDKVLNRIARTLERVELSAGQVLFEKGDVADGLYIIVDGSIRIHDDALVLRHLNKNEAFGEVATLDRNVRSASVTADTHTTLLRLERRRLHELLADSPDIGVAIINGLCRLMRDRYDDITTELQQIAAFERELEVGRTIQAGFLPDALPDIPGWEIAAHFEAARDVGGDYYDAFVLRGLNKIGLLIGDVCDKGVGAALFMTLFRSLLRAVAKLDEFAGWTISPALTTGERSVARLRESVTLTNNYVARTHGQTAMFSSLFFALLDPETGEFDYVNAGHEAPIIVNSGKVKTQLEPTGPAVGLMPDVRFDIQRTRLEHGDILFAFTDGVPEALNAAREPFTHERLIALLPQETSSANALLKCVMNALRNHIAGASQYDDITMLAIARA